MPRVPVPAGNQYTALASATDNAGNTATKVATFTVNVTPTSLCVLTAQFVQSSPNYPTLKPLQRLVIDALVKVACAPLDAITAKLTAKQKATLVSTYKTLTQALVSTWHHAVAGHAAASPADRI